MTATEEWRRIPFAPLYEASTLGRVRSLRTPTLCIIKQQLNKRTGYLQVTLLLDHGRYSAKPIHRIIGETFLGPKPTHLATRHLNGDPHDNRLENLRYGTYSENMQDQVRHGRHYLAAADACRKGHAYTPENTAIGKAGRRCKECARETSARSNARIRAERIADRLARGLPADGRSDPARRELVTECKWGHPYSGENVRYVKGESRRRVCRTCEKAAAERYLARRRGVLSLDVAA